MIEIVQHLSKISFYKVIAHTITRSCPHKTHSWIERISMQENDKFIYNNFKRDYLFIYFEFEKEILIGNVYIVS